MVLDKSLDEYKIIAALLCDVSTLHLGVFDQRSLRLTIQKIDKRCKREGIGFLTKTLPRLGKAIDLALSGDVPFDSSKLPFKRLPGSKLPKLFGELFIRVFSHDGRVLQDPSATCIRALRQLCYLFYKYKLPYTPELELEVTNQFKQTEDEISNYHRFFCKVAEEVDNDYRTLRVGTPLTRSYFTSRGRSIIRKARILLSRVFSSFNPRDIHPSHGPGAVSTGEQLWGKYEWTKISPRLLEQFPLDEYFYSSIGSVCDNYRLFDRLQFVESPARVLLVPKDSRGPRLISCEPLDFQWIQQGLGRAIVSYVEACPLTRNRINFTDQQPNRLAALIGSRDGRYATLDLKEASDRITVGLVRLLFPEPLLSGLMNSRSLSTVLPSGEEIKLNKFAPMGSALCFPVLALTIWALLNAAGYDTDARERILVYGDDVIVPTACAADAISILECFGLKVNRDKSCTSGFFRESCGLDAYRGIEVTPVRFRTVWTSNRCPDVYTSYIAYANACWDKRYYNLYHLIVEELHRIYGPIPEEGTHFVGSPSLRFISDDRYVLKSRINKQLQKVEYRCLEVQSRPIIKYIDGWKMLMRFFAESSTHRSVVRNNHQVQTWSEVELSQPLSVSSYTKRHTGKLVWRWR